MSKVHVGKNLAIIVEELKVKNTELAELLGKTRTHTYKIFEMEDISTSVLQKMHQEYGVDYNMFFKNERDLMNIVNNNGSLINIATELENNVVEVKQAEIEKLKNEVELLKEIIKTKDDLIGVLKNQVYEK